MTDKIITFPEEIRNKIKIFITERSGLYFKDHDLRGLENVIAARMKANNLDSPVSYYNFLINSESKEDEFRGLLNLLTVNHTYFFRNESQFKALSEKVFPEIIARKRRYAQDERSLKPMLRIWSAGCSTGEEPYSVAMVVKDFIPDMENWDIYILATDASTESLEWAQKGIFNANSVRLVPRQYLEKYFDLDISDRNKAYIVKKEIKEMVHFVFHNLIEDEFAQGFDIIFCRNVVIYFEFETIINIMHKFYSSLFSGGYLFIGYSENLHFMRDKFKMVNWEEAIYYRKETTKLNELFAFEDHPREEVNFEKIIEELSRYEAKAELEVNPGKVPALNIEQLIAEIIKNTHLKKYTKALNLIEEAIRINQTTAEPYYLAAEIHMNQGGFAQAKDMLAAALRLNPLFPAAHYLFGCIYLEEAQLDKAKESLRKALYLDKDFSLAHFYLANLYRQEGSSADAIREYRNALKGLSKLSLDAIIAYSGGFDAATLVNVCRDNIERLKLEG